MLVVLSCSTEPKDSELPNEATISSPVPTSDLPNVLEYSDSISLPLDDRTGPNIYITEYAKYGGQELIFTFNPLINGCNIYDLNTQEQVGSVSIPREGPNSIPELAGIKVVGNDSLLFMPKGNPYGVQLTDFQGDFYEMDLFEDIDRRQVLNPVANSAAPVYLEGTTLRFVCYPLGDFADPKTRDRDFAWEKVWDGRTGQVRERPIRTPASVIDKRISPILFCLGRVKGHDDYYVYTWPFSDQLIAASQDTVRRVDAFASEYRNRPLESLPLNIPKSTKLEQAITTTMYRYVYYDPYRGLYYRFAKLPMTFDPERHVNYYAFDEQELEIIVLNEDFDVVARKRLPDKTYGIFACFVGQDGLYIPRNNVHSSSYSEHAIRFDLFTVRENQE